MTSSVAGATVHLSVVSHGQGELVRNLLTDLNAHCAGRALRVTVTVNVPEAAGIDPRGYSFPVTILENPRPKGFGANHNAAFRHARCVGGDFFCVINPDVRLRDDPFGPLLEVFARMPDAGVVAPRVTDPDGAVEDSARRFPQPWTPVRRLLFGRPQRDSISRDERFFPDWIAGMFMLFRAEAYRQLNGFDERYFLYYEDVDLCGRLWLSGRRVVVEPSVSIVHAARRDSHRKLRYLLWHARGVWRFFTSATYRRIATGGIPRKARPHA